MLLRLLATVLGSIPLINGAIDYTGYDTSFLPKECLLFQILNSQIFFQSQYDTLSLREENKATNVVSSKQ